jgi:hypothetical protein
MPLRLPVTKSVLSGILGLLAISAQAQLSVSTISPNVNKATAPVNSPITITLSQPPSAATATALHVHSTMRGGQRGGGTATLGNTLTFTPSAFNWLPGETVWATLTTALQSTSGQNLAVARVFQFTTAVGGSGRGKLLPPAITPEVAVGSAPFGVALGDIDGDGDLDVVTANITANSVSVRLNRGLNSGVFAVPAVNPEPTVGTNPEVVRLADIDGDGDLDLLALNGNFGLPGSVSVRLNSGLNTGNFVAPAIGQEVPVSRSPRGLTLGDIDGDGDLDLLVPNDSNGSINVLLNDGVNSGHYAASATAPDIQRLTPPGFVALGDLDNDGDLDLVATGVATNTLSLRLNTGNGTFTTPANGTLTLDNAASQVALGDVDNDGDLDIATNTGSGNVLLNNNNATFSPSQAGTYASTQASSLTLADMDADGDLDIVAANYGDQTVSVRFNKQVNSGSFTGLDSNNDFSIAGRVEAIAVGDVDGDNDLDVVAVNGYGANTISVRLNQLGAAPIVPPTLTAFSPASGPVGTVVTLTGIGFTGTTAVSFNGVAAPNYTVVSATSLTVTVPLGATTGRIAVTAPTGTVSSSANFVVMGAAFRITGLVPGRNQRNAPVGGEITVAFSQALNNDAASRGALRVFSNQRGGRLTGSASVSGTALSLVPTNNFRPGETVAATLTTAVHSSTNSLAVPQVYQFTTATGGTGRGFFRPGTSVGTRRVPSSLATGDVDGDGDLDVVVATTLSNIDANSMVSVRLNGGDASGSNTGVFSGSQEVPVSANPGEVLLADMDSDGDLDLLTACEGISYGMLNVRLNGGDASGSNTGVFSGGSNTVITSGPLHLTIGDIDGDGDLDVVTSDRYSYYMSVFRNDGSGSLTRTARPSTGRAPTGIVLGDIDNDGDLDLLVANSGDGSVDVRLNGGDATGSNTGEFATPQTLFLGYAPSSLALGDIDGDGDLDLIVGNTHESARAVNVQLNGGDATGANPGVFSAGPDVVIGSPPVRALLGDVDADGDLDLVTVNAIYNGSMTVRLNGGDNSGSNTGSFTNPRTLAVGETPVGLALGDIDGDSDLDVLTANQGSSTVSVSLNTDGGGVLTSSANAVCAGSNAGTLTLSYAAGSVLYYQANTGAGYQNIPGTATTSAFSNLTTTTTYRAVVLNPYGQTVYSIPVTVTVNSVPVAGLRANNTTTICAGTSVTLTASGGGTYQFQRNGQALVGATAATYSATVAGAYTVAVTNSFGCTNVSTPVTVVVNPLPATPLVMATYSGPVTILSSNAPIGNQWYLNGAAVTGATDQTYSVSTTAQYGSYSVVVTNAEGCSSLPSSLSVVTATLSPPAGSSLSVHPNPTLDGQVTVTLSGYQQPVVLTVLTSLGQEVSSYHLAAGRTQQVLDLRALPTGLYLLRITTAVSTDVRRFVRE